MEYPKVAKAIIEIVGGKDNITQAYHCMTRLRIELKDTEKVDEKLLEDLNEVKGFVYNGSTIQIIIGPSIVDDLTDEFNRQIGAIEDSVNTGGQKRSIITVIQSIVMPSIGVVAGAAMFSALNSILGLFGVSSELPIMMFLSAIAGLASSAVPVFFAFNAAKTFGGNPYLGVFFAVLLASSTIEGIEIFGITLHQNMGGVIAVVATAIVGALFEKQVKKVIPDVIKLVFVPFFTMALTSIVLVIIIAPITNLINEGLISFVTFAMESGTLVYALASSLLALFWLPIIMTGTHIAVITLMIPVSVETGVVPIEPAIGMTMPALFGVTTAIFILYKNKSKTLKEIGASSVPLIPLGISEPALYGMITPNPILFINVGIAAAVAGFTHIMLGNEVTYPNAMGIFETFTTTNPLIFILCYALAFLVGFILTYVFNKNNLKYK